MTELDSYRLKFSYDVKEFFARVIDFLSLSHTLLNSSQSDCIYVRLCRVYKFIAFILDEVDEAKDIEIEERRKKLEKVVAEKLLQEF